MLKRIAIASAFVFGSFTVADTASAGWFGHHRGCGYSASRAPVAVYRAPTYRSSYRAPTNYYSPYRAGYRGGVGYSGYGSGYGYGRGYGAGNYGLGGYGLGGYGYGGGLGRSGIFLGF